MHRPGAARGEQFPAGVMQEDVRFARFPAAYLDILPAKLGADAGAKRFRNGLLGGKASGDKWSRFAMGKTVGNFVGPEDAFHQAVAKFLVRSFDARDLDNIGANAQDHTSAGITGHQPEHVFNGGTQAGKNRAADNAVADVQFHQVRHLAQYR